MDILCWATHGLTTILGIAVERIRVRFFGGLGRKTRFWVKWEGRKGNKLSIGRESRSSLPGSGLSGTAEMEEESDGDE